MTAQDLRMLRKISIRLVEAEERSQHIRKLVSKGLGFKEEEEFMNREKSKLKGGKVFDEKRKIIKLAMDEKWSDNFKLIYKLKKQRNRLRTRICGAYETKSRVLEGILKKIGNQAKLARQEARTRLKKKEQFLTKKYGGNTRLEGGIEELAKVDQSRFGAARIFDTDGKWEKEPSKEPAVVCDEGQELVLSKDEINLLKLGPKFCVLGHLSEENFEGELEQCILKYKWDVMGEEKGKQRQSLSDIAIDCVIGEEGKQESEEYASLLEAKCRMIFDHETATLDFGNRRATDVKNNARVIFPRTQDFQKEANLQMLRIEAMGVFRDYVKGNCDTRGRQKSNLSTSEQRGLKSLKKRVEEGQIVVMTTDKTGSFAVLGRERYLEAGLSHAQGDTEVGWGEIQTAQREVNGHISMLIKIFKIGKNWTHEGRIRETMIGESMETCPVHLLYKDHKGWDPAKGGVPPTRQVAGGNRGVNLYLSEVVSDILEPLVGMVEGGREVISMEDLAARIEDMNTAQEGWTSSSWWEGMVYGDLIACGKCNGSQDYIWQDGQPDRCRCPRNTGQEDTVLGKTRVTWEYMKTLRRLDWEKGNEWEDGDRDRVLDSTEALPEDVQDYSTPMVVIGSDVVNMYPSLDVDAVADMIAEEVQQIPIKWSNIDYLECARYLALNWTESQCRASPLRRVLPWRRGRRGTRPGITGTGPMGRERGDQEQWVFPTVKLTEEEKGLLIGNVVRIAIKAMFSRHYYSFGGKMFSQRRGGPIGLRGTCAVARFIMQIFDGKWEAVLRNVGLTFNLIARYMDDGRVFMPPLRPGWRWVNRRLQYTVRWEGEDYGLSPQERTKRAIGLSMNEIMTFLRFTTESGEEFKEGWLPTLDSNLMVDSTNTVLFRFWEKPTNSNKVVQFRTAMGENMKQQILTADMMRRMVNTSEECTDEDYCTIVDSYAQKIVNSGYGEEQARKIITAGIKGWRTKTDRCKKEGRRVRRTAQDSLGQRVKNKLLGKSSWFRKPGGAGRNKLTRRGGGLKGGSTSKDTEYPVRTVLFVEQTPRGELAAKMRELVSRLEPLLGFKIKIAERCGKTLQSQFPLNNLWGGTKCGREDCTTCEQDGAEELPDCTRRSVLYENACLNCLPSAGSKGGPKEGEGDPDTPAIYVGETSRSIMERSREHWASYRGGKEESHILKHQHVAHGGENDPRFIMRVVSQHRTALARQVSEAVRIGRRGGAGAVLNSKAEFNRCHIPRLRLEDEEERKQREQQMEQEDKLMEEERDREQEQWVTQRLRQRDKERREFGMRSSRKGRSEPRSSNSNSKRRGSTGSREEAPTKKRKKNRKYDLLEENWGAMDTIVEEPGEEGSLTRGVQEQQHTLPTDELTETVREEGLMVLEEEKSKPEEQEIVIAGVRSEMEDETLARVPSNTLVELNRMDQEERWDEQLQSDMFPDNDGGLCTLCIYNPCLCALTKLDMKIKALKTLAEQAPSPPQTPAERGVSSPPTVSPPSVGTPPPHQLQTRVTETSGPLLGTSPSPACGPPLTYPTFPPSNYPPISPHSPISPSTPHSSINVSTPQFINKKQSIAMNHDHSLSTHSSTPASTPHLSASPCTLHSPARKRSWDPENEQSLRRRRNTAIILKDKNILFERKTSLKIPDMWRKQMVKKRIPEVRDIHSPPGPNIPPTRSSDTPKPSSGTPRPVVTAPPTSHPLPGSHIPPTRSSETPRSSPGTPRPLTTAPPISHPLTGLHISPTRSSETPRPSLGNPRPLATVSLTSHSFPGPHISLTRTSETPGPQPGTSTSPANVPPSLCPPPPTASGPPSPCPPPPTASGSPSPHLPPPHPATVKLVKLRPPSPSQKSETRKRKLKSKTNLNRSVNSIRSYFENKNLKYKNTEDNSTISTNNRNLLLKTGNGNLASSTADTIAIREGSSDTVFGGSIEIRTTSSPRRAASRTCSISDVNPATYQENSRDELTETVREEGLMVLEEEKSKPEEREIVIAGVRSEMEEETLARVPSNTLVELNRMDQEERWEQDRKKKAVLVELNRMGQDGALVELNRMDQEGNREQEGIKKTVLVELNRMDQDSALVELNRMDQEGNGEQDGIKKTDLVELNRMDQDSALVELNRMDQEENGEQDGKKQSQFSKQLQRSTDIGSSLATTPIRRLVGSRRRWSPIVASLSTTRRLGGVPPSLAGSQNQTRTPSKGGRVNLFGDPDLVSPRRSNGRRTYQGAEDIVAAKSPLPSNGITVEPLEAKTIAPLTPSVERTTTSTLLKLKPPPTLNSSAQNKTPPIRKPRKNIRAMNQDQKPNQNIKDMIRKLNEKATEESQVSQPDQQSLVPPNPDHNILGGGSSANQTAPLCTFNKHGFCTVHRILGKQIDVMKSIWKERSGGRGFGFVRTKIKKFICPLRNSAPVAPHNYPGNNHTTSSNIGDIIERREGTTHVSNRILEHSSDNNEISRLADRTA